MPELKRVLYKILGTWDNSKFIFFDKTGKQINSDLFVSANLHVLYSDNCVFICRDKWKANFISLYAMMSHYKKCAIFR
jgi:hypothetical protein